MLHDAEDDRARKNCHSSRSLPSFNLCSRVPKWECLLNFLASALYFADPNKLASLIIV
jgi:hypothetical protein